MAYQEHATYLAHDLVCTEALYCYLWSRLTRHQRFHCRAVASPLLRVLTGLTATGASASPRFISQEGNRIAAAMTALSEAHRIAHGVDLAGLGDWGLRKLLYRTYGLRILRWRRGAKGEWPIDDETRERLLETTQDPAIRGSLQLIHAYKQLQSLRIRLGGYLPHIDRRTGRIHSLFDNSQAAGRVSSTRPNLQQLAKAKTVTKGTPHEIVVKTRNLLVASPGYILVAADVSGADVRVLAHEIDRCKVSTTQHRNVLLGRRRRRLRHAISQYLPLLTSCRNEDYDGGPPQPPAEFDPLKPHRLVEDFKSGTDDLYSQVASAITGRTITKADKQERDRWKTILLAQVNGQTANGLKDKLKCSKTQAQSYIDDFYGMYPDVRGWLDLMRQQVALAGQTQTWAGRDRTITAQHWMVNQPRVWILTTYRNGNKYWFDVTPLVPTTRYLTCHVHRIWSVADRSHPKLIYTPDRGRVGTRFYPEIDVRNLAYFLPIRNLAWSNIRRVRRLDATGQPVEEAKYEGMFTTCRVAINAIMQGGTMDIVTVMMLRSQPVADAHGARLLLQIHDELVWEVPYLRYAEFVYAVKTVLEQPPSPEWRVPIIVEPKIGFKFGEMI